MLCLGDKELGGIDTTRIETLRFLEVKRFRSSELGGFRN
jgi:hypothetical protein